MGINDIFGVRGRVESLGVDAEKSLFLVGQVKVMKLANYVADGFRGLQRVSIVLLYGRFIRSQGFVIIIFWVLVLFLRDEIGF